MIYPIYQIDGTPVTSNVAYTPFGFYAVYLNLFKILNDSISEDMILQMYPEHRFITSDGRVWIKNEDEEMKWGKKSIL